MDNLLALAQLLSEQSGSYLIAHGGEINRLVIDRTAHPGYLKVSFELSQLGAIVPLEQLLAPAEVAPEKPAYMASGICPKCNLPVPLAELQSHYDAHRAELVDAPTPAATMATCPHCRQRMTALDLMTHLASAHPKRNAEEDGAAATTAAAPVAQESERGPTCPECGTALIGGDGGVGWCGQCQEAFALPAAAAAAPAPEAPPAPTSYPCLVPGCGKSFGKPKGLQVHQWRKHPGEEDGPEEPAPAPDAPPAPIVDAAPEAPAVEPAAPSPRPAMVAPAATVRTYPAGMRVVLVRGDRRDVVKVQRSTTNDLAYTVQMTDGEIIDVLRQELELVTDEDEARIHRALQMMQENDQAAAARAIQATGGDCEYCHGPCRNTEACGRRRRASEQDAYRKSRQLVAVEG